MGAWGFSYDSLNRLTTGTPAAGNQSNNGQNLCWAYDDFGNRTAQDAQSAACPSAPAATASYNANNQLTWTSVNAAGSNFTYDAAGDATNDNANQYLYDGEGRICAVKNLTVGVMTGYIYDAEGTRVSKGTLTYFSCDMNPANSDFNGYTPTNDYILGPSGEQVTEMGVGGASDGSATSNLVWQHTNIWSGGALLGTYDGGAGSGSGDTTYGLHFYFNDPLGTRRVQTDYAGVVEQTCSSLPYGDQLACTGSTITPTEHHFTGKERDAESGLDDFGARYYASSLGRFMSPDWSVKVEPVPYAKLGDPQSLNLYAYMMNNPLGGVDEDGHDPPPAFSSDSYANGYAGTALDSQEWVSGLHDAVVTILESNTATPAQQQNAGPTTWQQVGNAIDQASDWTNTYLAIPMAALQLGENEGEDDLALDQLSEGEGVVEEKAEAVESSVSSKIESLTTDAEKTYPKLAGKFQNHHIFPQFLSGPKNGELSNIPAAYHQLITNEFRTLTSNYQDLTRSVEDLMRAVYSKFPLP